MKLSHILVLSLAVVGLGITLYITKNKQVRMERALPIPLKLPSKEDAMKVAGDGAIPVAGTGSMAPLIPPAPEGGDLMGVVALAKIDPSLKYKDLTEGMLCVYKTTWSKYPVMHGASLRDRYGWIMSGLHNKHSEASWRMTEETFIGVVTEIYLWPLPQHPE